MNLTLLLLIPTIFANLLLAIFVYKNNPRSATNRIFSAIAVITSLWLGAMYLAQARELLILNLFFIRLTTFLAAPMALSFYLFAYTLPAKTITLPRDKVIRLYALTVFAMVLALSPFVFSDIKIRDGASMPVVGFGLAIYGVIAIYLSLGSIYGFAKRIWSAEVSPAEKQQLIFVLCGSLMMWGLIIGTIFAPVLFYGSDFFVPFAPVYVLIFLAMAAYAVIKRRFLDVRFILYRAVSLLLADLLLALCYALIVLVFLYATYNTFDTSFFFIMSLAAISTAVLTFDYLEKTIRGLTDRLFFQGEYDRDALLSSLTDIMVDTIDLDELTRKILKTIKSGMRLADGAFLIIGNHEINDIKGAKYKMSAGDRHELEALFHETDKNKRYFSFEDQEEGALKNAMRKLDIFFTIPIRVESNEVALLVLGPKLSGEVYYERDIELLEIFASESGVAIQNAKAYTEIKNFSRELEQKVVERTRELKEAQARELSKAQDLVKLKDEFVFIAAHELRAPVTAIRGFLDLAMETKVKFPKDVNDDLRSVLEATGHLNTLVNQLLEIARADSQTMKIETEPVAVVSLVGDVIKELSSLAIQKKVKVKIESVNKDVKALADIQKVKEVLENLIGNAIKYNRDGGRVNIAISEEGDRVKIEVADTGYGIPAADQPKIFEKFFRSINDHTKQLLGTGLGLFITRMLVEKMSGTISFSSVEGEGSTFTVSLPRA